MPSRPCLDCRTIHSVGTLCPNPHCPRHTARPLFTQVPGEYDRDWDKLSARKRKATPYCEIAGPGCTGGADHADHILPVRTHPHLRLVYSNLQSACTHCHAVKTGDASVMARRSR